MVKSPKPALRAAEKVGVMYRNQNKNKSLDLDWTIPVEKPSGNTNTSLNITTFGRHANHAMEGERYFPHVDDAKVREKSLACAATDRIVAMDVQPSHARPAQAKRN